ncbi:Predicted arabinose efflux permease, MFS family [Kaistia soli DSM 19436]|uniref:Predicted arabinose efflux permease, MFS family n=1 Tax=Kaistia soli DSM 19436 TaxID=1122133 RepID=A0A1M5DSI9_9HYPH|nr:MFS transporter [Kaistia soli]SHF69920.1 Predicted arabinose efflux permease, MFS family [Kaistia soli DSM 19436]
MLRSLIWLSFGTFAIGTEGFMIAGILPAMASDLQVSVAMAGHLVTCFALVYAISAPLTAVATASLPRKPLLAASIAAFALANLVAAIAPGYWWLMGSRALLALSAAAFTPAATGTAAMIAAPEKRGRAIAIIYSGMTIAVVVGVPAGTILAEHLGWRATFIGVAGLAVLALIGIVSQLPQVAAPPAASLGTRLAVARRPEVLSILGLTVLAIAGAFTVSTYAGALLKDVFNVSPSMIAFALFVVGIGSAAGNFFGGYAADRWNQRRFITTILVTLAVDFVAISLAATFAPDRAGLVVVVVALGIWGLFAWALPAVQQVRLVAVDPPLAAVSLSLNSSAIYLGTAAGATAGAAAIDLASVTAIGWVAALFEVAALIVFALTTRAGRRTWFRRDDIPACPGSGAQQRA